MFAFNYFPLQTQEKKKKQPLHLPFHMLLGKKSTLPDIVRRKLEGIYPLHFAWGGKHCISLLPTASDYFSSLRQAPALWNSPTHTEPPLSCTKTLFNQSFQTVYFCNPNFFQDKPQRFQKPELSIAENKTPRFHPHFQNLYLPFYVPTLSLRHGHRNAAMCSRVCASRRIYIQRNLPLATKALQFLPL